MLTHEALNTLASESLRLLVKCHDDEFGEAGARDRLETSDECTQKKTKVLLFSNSMLTWAEGPVTEAHAKLVEEIQESLGKCEEEFMVIDLDPPTPEMLERMQRIILNHNAEEIEGVLVDVQTASAIRTVAENLNSDNQAKVLSLEIEKMGLLAWKILGRQKS